MKNNEEFFVSYIEGSLGANTKRTLMIFILAAMLIVVGTALVFGLSQSQFKNSSFELSSVTKITGIYHENPYGMLRVSLAENTHKNVLLVGFGKFDAHEYFRELTSEVGDLNGKKISIQGNLIYYSGKTLIQITDEKNVSLVTDTTFIIPQNEVIREMTLQGEVIDPKCYFGVMKPGRGKIHRSCAIRCISGGIPPVFATSDDNNLAQYFLMADTEGKPINKDILPFVGKPAKIVGVVEKNEDWYTLKIDVANIELLNTPSAIY